MFDFSKIKTIAVVGLSNNPDRPAYFVSEYMKNKGFRIIPINPQGEEVLGEKGYKRLADIPADVEIDVANFFMRAEKLLPFVEEALDRGIKLIWLQQGIVSEEAARLAREKGAEIIMDKCIKVEHMNAGSR